VSMSKKCSTKKSGRSLADVIDAVLANLRTERRPEWMAWKLALLRFRKRLAAIERQEAANCQMAAALEAAGRKCRKS